MPKGPRSQTEKYFETPGPGIYFMDNNYDIDNKKFGSMKQL